MRKFIAVIVAVATCSSIYMISQYKEKDLYFCIAYHFVIPLPLIFFSKEISSLTGIAFWQPGPAVNKESPSCLIEFIGWLFLLAPTIMLLFKILK